MAYDRGLAWDIWERNNAKTLGVVKRWRVELLDAIGFAISRKPDRFLGKMHKEIKIHGYLTGPQLTAVNKLLVERGLRAQSCPVRNTGQRAAARNALVRMRAAEKVAACERVDELWRNKPTRPPGRKRCGS